MDEQRRKGLCYTCDSKLFLIEVVDKEVGNGGNIEQPPEEDL
jgi:hypothetical protein